MSLPQDTKGAAAGGANYFKAEKGQNKILIVGDAVTGYEYWTADNKVFRSPEVFEETPGIRTRKVKDKGGNEKEVDEKQKFFWALPVYDYADKTIKIYEITQKKVRDALAGLQANEDWGNPVGKYSVTITREGDGLTTSYTVTPNPAKEGDKTIAEAMALYEKEPVDIAAAMFTTDGEDF